MAKPQIYNESSGQYEDDPNAPDPNGAGFTKDASNSAPVGSTSTAQAQAGMNGSPTVTSPWTKGPADSTWLNWIHSAYGDSASRGGGFADLPQGTNMQDVVNRFNTDTGSNAKYLGGASGDQVDFGQGGRDVRTSGGQLWYDYGAGGVPGQGGGGAPGGGAPPTAAPAAAPISMASGGTTMTAEETAKQAQDAALRKQLIDQLTQRSQQSLAINPADPVISGQVDAYSAEQERAKRNYLADVAERTGPLSNIAGETRMANEKAGQNTSGYQADLMGRELTSRRAEISQALSSMQGMLTTDQENTLRMQLAQMDDAIKRMGLAQNQSQFTASQAQNASQFGATQAQQAQQFGQSLGYNYDNFDWQRSPLNPANFPSAA